MAGCSQGIGRLAIALPPPDFHRLDSASFAWRTENVDFEGRMKTFVSLFQIRRQHIFDPFHECADSARQIAPMRHDEGHGERPATKLGHDLHKRSTL